MKKNNAKKLRKVVSIARRSCMQAKITLEQRLENNKKTIMDLEAYSAECINSMADVTGVVRPGMLANKENFAARVRSGIRHIEEQSLILKKNAAEMHEKTLVHSVRESMLDRLIERINRSQKKTYKKFQEMVEETFRKMDLEAQKDDGNK